MSLSLPDKTDVLVTGGAGFLGSHLCERLLRNGCRVVCLDNFSTGRMENVRHLLPEPGFSVLEHDVREPLSLPVHRIYHLACPASPMHYRIDPVNTTKTIVLGTANVLDLAVEQQARVFHASTSEVYGDPEVHPQAESYRGNVNPLGPRACYNESKRCAETLCFDYHRQHGVGIKVGRIFNSYGPRTQIDDGRVISNFVSQALQNKEITVYGSGEQTRSFCYVDDTVEGMVRLMETGEALTGPINLGSTEEVSIQRLAEMVVDLVGSQSRIVRAALPEDDPRRRRPDITLAKQELGWEPSIPMEQGLTRVVAYFDELLRNQ